MTHFGKNSVQRKCGTCIQPKHAYDCVFAPYIYDYPVDYFIQSLKFNDHQEFARLMGCLLAKQVVSQNRVDYPELLLPVPLHKQRYIKRGFNQSDLIARYCSKLLRVPVNNMASVRVRETTAQMSLSRRERLINLKNAFKVVDLQGIRSVAIVDDVFTTGSTANEFAKALKNAGIRKVDVWAFAIAIV